jgi:hypothetical protein
VAGEPQLLLVGPLSTNEDRGTGLQTVRDRQERAARNQSLLREANERIAALEGRPPSVVFEWLCECCLDGCDATVSLSTDEYRDVRLHATRFVVEPGHVDQVVERVVSATDRYQVVEKQERAAEVAAHFDPRRRTKL